MRPFYRTGISSHRRHQKTMSAPPEVRICRQPELCAPSVTRSPDKHWNNRERAKRQEVGCARDGITRFKILTKGQAPNPQDECELGQKHQTQRNSSHGQPPQPQSWNTDMLDHPPGRENRNGYHDRCFHQFRRAHTHPWNQPKRADSSQHESGGKDDGEIKPTGFESILHS